jgi:dolichol-phosphate hexosyltransferase
MLSILMPVFDEEERVGRAVKQALDVDYPCEVELIVVDDGSVDATVERLEQIDDTRLRVLRHDVNKGKGAAIRTAAAAAGGEMMVILDADLEYDPRDIPRLLDPVLDGRARVVYGSRSFGGHSSFSFWYVMATRASPWWPTCCSTPTSATWRRASS